MAELKVGDIVKTTADAPKGEVNLSSVKVLKLLGEGGQGWVYLVEYQGKKMALKWYKNYGNDPDAFYNNLKNNVNAGSPSPVFLWPKALVEWTNDSFGYVMDLRPEGYYELTEFLLARRTFKNFRVEVEACIQVASAFRILHNRGLSYQDLNDGNFFINPETGDVKIADNDNVAKNESNMGIMGKPRYMAPEIVTGRRESDIRAGKDKVKNYRAMPDKQSDRFSLAVIIFAMLCLGHPLEGKRWASIACMTPQDAEQLYGKDPVFIFDEKDTSNRPIKENTNVINRWSYLPDYMQKLFLTSFSKEAFTDQNRRVTELNWLKALTRFRSEIVPCQCGKNEVFIKNAASTVCEVCKKPVKIDHKIKVLEYAMAASRGTRLYRCQLGLCSDEEALEPVALVVTKPDAPDVLGVKNMTNQIWEATTPSGQAKRVDPQVVIPFKAGIKIKVFDHTFELE